MRKEAGGSKEGDETHCPELKNHSSVLCTCGHCVLRTVLFWTVLVLIKSQFVFAASRTYISSIYWVLANCVSVVLGTHCEHPWYYHMMRPSNLATWKSCHIFAGFSSISLKAQRHCIWSKCIGSVEKSITITWDCRVLQNAWRDTMDCHCLFQCSEDLDLRRYCSCKVREIHHLYQHILGIRPKIIESFCK